jgi:hypothetical protein
MQLAQIEGSGFQEKFQREEKWTLAYLSMIRSEDNEKGSDARSRDNNDGRLSLDG